MKALLFVLLFLAIGGAALFAIWSLSRGRGRRSRTSSVAGSSLSMGFAAGGGTMPTSPALERPLRRTGEVLALPEAGLSYDIAAGRDPESRFRRSGGPASGPSDWPGSGRGRTGQEKRDWVSAEPVDPGPMGPAIPAGPAPARAALGPGPQFSFNNAVDDEPLDDSFSDRFTTGTHGVVKPFMSTAAVPTVIARPAVEQPAATTGAGSGSPRPSSLFGDEVRGPELSPRPPEAPSTSETERVDLVLRALIDRARTQRVGIAQVAAELVEQAHVEKREIDAVLADLVVRDESRQAAAEAQAQTAGGAGTPAVADQVAVGPAVAESADPGPADREPVVAEPDRRQEDTVVVADRLEELTFFNKSVPSRPGQMSDFELLDPEAKRRVIIRVLCLLVAMQDDNPRLPSQPRSEAEKRQWPLARAVWPVPAAAVSSDSDTIVLSESAEVGSETDMIDLSDSSATNGDADAVPSSPSSSSE
jgi:hypothetical protein